MAFERERTLFDFNGWMLHRLLADFDDAAMRTRPSHGANPPAWIVGHLAMCTDLPAMLLGEPPRLKDWHERFGPGSRPAADPAEYPAKGELVDAYDAGHGRVAGLLGSIGADHPRLAQPHGVDLLAATPIRTVGELIAHLLGTHECFHLGQLSGLRRQQGHTYIF